MSMKSYPKGIETQISEHFKSTEFDCHCSVPTCNITGIDSGLISLLEKLRSVSGGPIRINSGYRCAQEQAALKAKGYETAAGVSQHQLGGAADIMFTGAHESTPGTQIEALARQAGFTSVGVGHNWCHVDIRAGYRRWEYKHR